MKPILFNTEMVRAILEGRKTVTRRIVKPQPTYSPRDGFSYKGRAYGTDLPPTVKGAGYNLRCAAPYKVGDVLYVRETWNWYRAIDNKKMFIYRADYGEEHKKGYWKPSIHMPKAAARIFLKVTNVRVERLQDMTKEDALKEGINPKLCVNLAHALGKFKTLWNYTINKDQKESYSWEANPYVWVIEFEVITKEEALKYEQ